MINLKNISGSMLIFYGMLESGSAVFFKPDETLEFSEAELNGNWRKTLAKYGSTSIEIVEAASKAESKPKAETPKKPAGKPAADPKGETKTSTPAKPNADTKSDATKSEDKSDADPKGEGKAETSTDPEGEGKGETPPAKPDGKPEAEDK